jgi:hypothetical protein
MIVVCTAALPVHAQDDSDSVVRTRIIALEKAWNQAYKAGDTRALDSILDNEVVLINDDALVNPGWLEALILRAVDIWIDVYPRERHLFARRQRKSVRILSAVDPP